MDNALPYQLDVATRILEAVKKKRRRILAVMPTGSGRGKVIESLVQDLLAMGTPVMLLGLRRAELDQMKSRFEPVDDLYRNGTLKFATPSQLWNSKQNSQPKLAGHVVIAIESNFAAPETSAGEPSRVWAALDEAASVVGFTVMPTAHETSVYGDPVFTLNVRDAVFQGILPTIVFENFGGLGFRNDATEAQIREVLSKVVDGIGTEKCVFVSRFTAVVSKVYSLLAEMKPTQVEIARISNGDSQDDLARARSADWIAMSPSLMGGYDLPQIRHVVLLDHFPNGATLLDALRYVLRTSHARVWDFGSNLELWNTTIQGDAAEVISRNPGIEVDAISNADTFSLQKWIRPQADGAAARDLMDRDRLIHVLRGIIKSKSEDRSLAIGLFGRWGSGKSTIVNLLKQQMADGKDVVFIEFNAWENEQASSMPAALADAITQQIYRQRSALGRFWVLVKHRILINDALFNLTICALIVLLATMVPTEKLDEKLHFSSLAVIGPKAQDLMKVILPIFLLVQVVWNSPLAQGLRGMLRQVGYAEHVGLPGRLRNDLKNLFMACDRRGPIRDFVRKKFGIPAGRASTYVIVIDDLDRCSRQNVWSVVEATRLVADFRQVVLVFAVDYRLLFEAIAERLHDKAAGDGERHRLSREFLAKILQLSVQLPEPSNAAVARYIAQGLFEGVVDTGPLLDDSGELSAGASAEDEFEGGESAAEASAPPQTEDNPLSDEDEQIIEKVDEYIASTPLQKRIFQECASVFEITNPRALLRIYNSLTLIKGMHPEVGDSEAEYRRHAFAVFLTELCATNGRAMADMEKSIVEAAEANARGPWENVRAYAERYTVLAVSELTPNLVVEQRATTTSLPFL